MHITAVYRTLVMLGLFLQMTLTSKSTRREQYVGMGPLSSTVLPCTSGMPHGSILDPLIFVCYINDLVSFVQSYKSKIYLFADDINMYLV